MLARSFAALVAAAAPISALAADVFVSLDMDAEQPGRQHAVTILPGNGVIAATLSVLDPSESHALISIGYLGGIDRGIAFGHVASDTNHGEIVGLTATAGAPVNPGNTGFSFAAFSGSKAFDGPELQYVEWGASQPAIIRANADPILRLQIEYRAALPCDTFDFHVADYVTIWRSSPPGFPVNGAFSTTGLNSLDTGGDATPDQTLTLAGMDADMPVPVPPGAFVVDFVDGPPGGGPATLRVTWPGDLNGDRAVDLQDLSTLLAHFGQPADYSQGDIDGDGLVRLGDLSTLLAFFGNRCPRS